MTSGWLYIGVFFLIVGFFPGIVILIAKYLSPRKPNPIKNQIYECGMETVGESRVQIKAQYYIFGLIFLVFDVEVVFLYPWAVAFQQMTLYGVLEGIIFIVILFAALLNLWRKGALEWV